MEEKDNRGLENFFKNSLENFDQEPDDQVWSKVTAMLDNDEENKKTPFWLNFFSKLPIYLLSTLTLAVILSYLTNDHKLFSIRTVDQISETTQSSYNDKKAIVQTTTQPNLIREKTIEQQKSRLETRTTPIKKVITKTSNPKSVAPYTAITKENRIENNFTTQPTTQSIKADIPKMILFSASPKDVIELKRDLLNAITHLELYKSKLLSNKERVLPTVTLGKSITPHQVRDNSSKYSIGLSARFFHTAVNDADDFNGSESYGLVQDFKLFPSLELNLGMYFNVQHYNINTNSDTEPLDRLIVRQYTNRNIADDGVTQIDASTQYYDMPLGLRWHFRNLNEKTSLYINPAIVWQVYLPQKFGFTTVDDKMGYRDYKGINASLGSSSLSLGMERKIGNSLALQLSLWGEYSFIRLGVQNEKFKMLGIKSSLLFGK